MESAFLEAEGSSGGLLTMWNEESFKADIVLLLILERFDLIAESRIMVADRVFLCSILVCYE